MGEILTLTPSVQDHAVAIYNKFLVHTAAPVAFYTGGDPGSAARRTWLTNTLLEAHLLTALLWHVQGIGRPRSPKAVGGVTKFDYNILQAFRARLAGL
jgi:hypothetical protein